MTIDRPAEFINRDGYLWRLHVYHLTESQANKHKILCKDAGCYVRVVPETRYAGGHFSVYLRVNKLGQKR